MKFNTAALKPDSLFFPIFPDGKAPIKNVFRATPVQLEGSDETEAYLLDWSRCTHAQRVQLAAQISEAFGNVAKKDFLAWMDRGGELPIRVSSTISATLGADMRSFL